MKWIYELNIARLETTCHVPSVWRTVC